MVSMTGSGDVERDEIPAVLAWTARRLVEAALDAARAPGQDDERT